jgi:Ca2+-binding RTX toxin-like protein
LEITIVATVTGTNASETLNALDGVTGSSDTIFGLGGNDIIFGLGGNDEIKGGGGADAIDGGTGYDTASYSDSAEGVIVSLVTGEGFGGTAEGDTLINIEHLTGSSHDDWLIGDDGYFNFLRGGSGDDILMGGGGYDVLIGGAGADTLMGGSDRDEAHYGDSPVGVFVSLVTGTGSGGDAEGDTLSGIEDVSGSDYDDWIVGDDGLNDLHGYDGDDMLIGGGGEDFLWGNNGTDTASYADSGEGVVVYLDLNDNGWGAGYGGTAEQDFLYSIENLVGSSYADTLTGDGGNNVLKGGGGADTLYGEGGADTLSGEGGADTLKGGGGSDTLYGGDGADTLFGMNGSDTLYGDNGQDTLNGGNGRDFLTGGNGADTFAWWETSETSTGAANADVIRDFNRTGGDVIDLSDIDANVYAGGNQTFTFIGTAAFSGSPGEIRYYHSGGNTYIEMQTGVVLDVEGVIRLDGIHNPQASWFVL